MTQTTNPPPRLPRSTRYIEAVDAQLDLLGFWKSGQGRAYANGYVEYSHEMDGKHGPGAALQHSPSEEMIADGLTEGDMLAIREYHSIRAADTYWVSTELGQVIGKAAKTLPDEPLSSLELPTPSGFVFLETPIYVTDIHGDKVGIKIFRWAPTVVKVEVGRGRQISTRGLHVSWYGDKHDPLDESLQRIARERPEDWAPVFERMHRWSLWHQDIWFWAEMSDRDRDDLLVRPGEIEDEEGHQPRVTLRGVSEWDKADLRAVIGDETLIPNPDENQWLWISGSGDPEGVERWMNTFFRFTSQDITRVSHGHLPRALRRRCDRADAPHWGDVRIIDLRRAVYTKGDQEPDDEAWLRWTHRWEVNGHWHRYWVGSEKEGNRRWIWKWVAKFVKGPDHLPLIPKTDVRRVVR